MILAIRGNKDIGQQLNKTAGSSVSFFSRYIIHTIIQRSGTLSEEKEAFQTDATTKSTEEAIHFIILVGQGSRGKPEEIWLSLERRTS